MFSLIFVFFLLSLIVFHWFLFYLLLPQLSFPILFYLNSTCSLFASPSLSSVSSSSLPSLLPHIKGWLYSHLHFLFGKHSFVPKIWTCLSAFPTEREWLPRAELSNPSPPSPCDVAEWRASSAELRWGGLNPQCRHVTERLTDKEKLRGKRVLVRRWKIWRKDMLPDAMNLRESLQKIENTRGKDY